MLSTNYLFCSKKVRSGFINISLNEVICYKRYKPWKGLLIRVCYFIYIICKGVC